MKKAHREELVASIQFSPPAPLSVEERAVLQRLNDGQRALRQIEEEKRTIKNVRQREKNHGRASSVAFTPEEKVRFDARKRTIKAALEADAKDHSIPNLRDRLNFESSRTRWTLISTGQGAPEGHVSHLFSPEGLRHELFNILHCGGSVEEVLVNEHRLTPEAREEFLALAIQEERDHRRGR